MNKFTPEEDEIIKQYYEIGGSVLVKQHLTVICRDLKDICNRASRLGIKLTAAKKKEINKRATKSFRCFQNADAARYKSLQKENQPK